MKNLPPVSIIIPTLNEEDYIGNLLASLVAQTYQNFEVIVVDVSGNNKTLEACRRFEPLIPNLSLIKSSKRGVSPQRNKGASKAIHDRILFLDADIILPCTFLEISLNEISKTNSDIATCYIWPLSSHLLDYTLHLVSNVGVDIAKHVMPAIFGCTIFSTKTLHTKIRGFNEKMHFAEDQEYAQQAVKKGAKFLILKKTSPYVSVRRLDYEGRFNSLKKGILYGILALAYGKEEAQKYLKHETVDYEKIKMGITLSSKKVALPQSVAEELREVFNPLVKYPIAGSRVVFNGAKSVIGKLNTSLQHILED